LAIRHSTFVVLGWLMVASAASAQSGGDYEIVRSTIAGGGGTTSGEDYQLSGTAGQHDPGALTGEDYALTGGFWPAACACRLYGDFVEPFCEFQPDVDDLTYVVCGFSDLNACPEADIFPCAPDPCMDSAECAASVTGAVCINGGCRCTTTADCLAAGAVCNVNRQGGRCELADVDDLTALVQAYGGIFACPHPCPP
jgi:hypothetical protein